MTNRHQRPGAIARGLALALLLAPLPLAAGAAQGTDLWGGPGAMGAGLSARFDTTVFVTGASFANGSVEYWVGGSLVDTVPFTVAGRGTKSVATPATLDGLGAFLIRIRTDAPVGAWSETYNDTPVGRFGVAIPAFGPADFLNPGDEALGGGASASTDPAGSRTNVGVLCSGNGSDSCQVEVTVYQSSVYLGVGTVSASPGSAAQQGLGALVPLAAGRSVLTLRFRVLAGASQPYAILNDNGTSDASLLPLAVTRGAFSTAPIIDSFDLRPTSGCAPLSATATWSTTGAARVTLSGVSGDLPPTGTTTVTVLTTQDVVLTAIAPSGERTSQPIHLSVTPPVDPPAPIPATAVTSVGGSVTGSIPPTIYPVTTSFDRQDSTGSTFTLNGTGWTYVAGTAAGTDVVRLTLKGPCGDLSSTFTVTVQPSGLPVITSFTADPLAGCNTSNVVLSWSTRNAVKVTIPEVTAEHSFPPNGQTGVTITTATTFNLTAFNALGQKKSTSLTVPVDTQPYTPILDKNNLVVGSFTIFQVNVTGVPDPSLLRFVYAQNQSGSIFGATGNPGQFTYAVGTGTGNDVIRIFYTNGCGSAFTELHITVM